MRLLVERPVVDRERDAARELLGELDIVRREAPLAPPAERERAERAAAHDQRCGQHRAQLDLAHRLAMRLAAVGAVRQVVGDRHELRPAFADRHRDRSAARDVRSELLEDAGGFLHLGIRVHERATLDHVAPDEIDDALVGDRRHGELGQRAKRGVRVERAREVLADRGEHREGLARAALGVVQACALERVRAVLGERRGEGALGLGEAMPALEAEAECAEHRTVGPQRHRGGRRGRRAHPRIARLELALVEEDRDAVADRVADRRVHAWPGSAATPPAPPA